MWLPLFFSLYLFQILGDNATSPTCLYMFYSYSQFSYSIRVSWTESNKCKWWQFFGPTFLKLKNQILLHFTWIVHRLICGKKTMRRTCRMWGRFATVSFHLNLGISKVTSGLGTSRWQIYHPHCGLQMISFQQVMTIPSIREALVVITLVSESHLFSVAWGFLHVSC